MIVKLKAVTALLCLGFIGVGLLVVLIDKKYRIEIDGRWNNETRTFRVLTCLFVGATILAGTLPMGFSPIWNGEIPEWRNQYEELAESMAEGHIDLNDPVDPKLLEMDNPYDFNARVNQGVSVAWDHAFYNGHYYMYFGIVPVLLLFLPYRLITGSALTTFHATQFFSVLLILGIFSFFMLLIRVFIKKLPFCLYILLSVFASILSISIAISSPALYCTAIISAVCFAVWSLYFFMRAAYESETGKQKLLFLFIGGLFGALEFGCRPPIGLSNIIAIPLFIECLKDRKTTKPAVTFFTAIPYIAVAAGLMYYNQVRFDSVFEFGQSYQMTVTDQTHLGDNISVISSLKTILYSIYYYFLKIDIGSILNINEIGLFFSCPVLWILIAAPLKKIFQASEAKQAGVLFKTMLLALVIIIVIDNMWSPYPIVRYRLDICWLLGIMTFLAAGFYYKVADNKKQCISVIGLLTLLSTYFTILLIAFPHEQNFTSWYMRDIKKVLYWPIHLITQK